MGSTKTSSTGGSRDARCPASWQLINALEKAILFMSWEFKTPHEIPSWGMDCFQIRQSWEKNVVSRFEALPRHERQQRRLASALKSCKRIFDIPCTSCDKIATKDAKKKWEEHIRKDVPMEDRPSKDALDELRLVVRELLSGWGRGLKESRGKLTVPFLGEYVPDQQGCYERTSMEGGTLSVSDSESELNPVNRLRLGSAKTKGKIRVVTMQTAKAKRTLSPVHNALYDHITSSGWCVRGDVKKGDFDVVVDDVRKGECLISGDYKAATDNIYLDSIDVIVSEISKCEELTDMEREVLIGSFREPEYKKTSCMVGEHLPIKRGSMMGNLVSFPILCLLNKSCYDIACNIRDPGDRTRKGRFNGDDCMFAGDMSFMTIWRDVTKRYGLIVNEEKTGISRRWVELNSQPYCVRTRKMVSKPVLSFLLPSQTRTTGLLTDILEGTKSFCRSTVKQILGMMKFEIAACGVVSDLSSLTPYWRKVLVKFRWFRASAILGGAPVLEKGVNRAQPVVVGPPPYSGYYDRVTRMAVECQRDHVNEWKGIPVKKYTQKLDKKTYARLAYGKMPNSIALRRFEFIGFEWAFVWPKLLYEVVAESFPYMLMSHKDRIRTKWLDDHPFLTRCPRIVEVGTVRKNFFPPPVFPSLSRAATSLQVPGA